MTFYTYMWLREDGSPYYVGKGTWKRAHRKGAPSEDRIIMQEWPCEEDAFTAEKLLIAVYGRESDGGVLINRTDGGEGPTGLKHTVEFKQARREWMLAHKRTKVHCQNLSKSLKSHGVRPTVEALEASRIARIGKPSWNKGLKTGKPSWNASKRLTQEHRKSLVEAWKRRKEKGLGVVWNKGTKGLQVAWNKSIPCPEETKKKISNTKRNKEKRVSM